MTPDLVIRFEVNNVRSLTDTERVSPIVMSHDIPWKFTVKKETSKRTDNIPYFATFLHCNWETENRDWRVDYNADFVIINGGEEKMTKSLTYYNFHPGELNRGYFKFEPFADFISAAKGLLDGDKLTIECRIEVLKVSGMRKKISFDFSTPSAGMNNVVLKIGDQRLNVSKDLLALHSPVFASTFFGKFEEKSKDEIELHDIAYDEFVDLLNVIYPTSFEITAINLHHILKLADRFQVESVLDRIITYLSSTSKFDTPAKLKIGEQFRLQRLINFCINSFTTIDQVKALKVTPEYKSFSDSLRGAICDRILEF